VGHLVDALDAALREPADGLEAALRRARQALRAFRAALADGNYAGLQRSQRELDAALAALGESAERLRARCTPELWAGGPSAEENEAYARAWEEACAREGLPLQGTFPVYRLFPLEIRFDLAERSVLVNRKRRHELRPESLARILRQTYDRLHRARFDAGRFRRALLRAHTLLSGDRPQQPVLLRQIYELLTLREGGRSAEYSLEQFGFDIYRLRRAGLTEGNRRLVFIHGRRNAIVVPVGDGQTENLTALQIQEVG
jgi:hypothetical protein